MPTLAEPIPLSEVAVLDHNAEALGVSVRTLMEAAGEAVARMLGDEAPPGPLTILVGPGNNGGDGLVVARHLASSRPTRVVLAAPAPRGALPVGAFDALPKEVTVHRSKDLDEDGLAQALDGSAVLLDALLGAGAWGEPRGEVARVLQAQAGLEAWRASVDAPTGAGTSHAFVPDLTVALQAPKQLPDRAEAGRVVTVDIGIPERAWTHTGPGELLALYPRPGRDQHKGQGGFVLVVGGGPYSGAPALSATAAMRAGADLSVVLCPENVWQTVASFSPNIVARPLQGPDLDLHLPANRVELNKWLGMVDAVVIGPGLGKMGPIRQSVPVAVERIRELGLPFVADADALWALSGRDLDLKGRAVLTPHAKEFEVLTGKAVPPPDDVEGRVEVARGAARRLNATILLKGPVDVIASPDRVKRNATGTPAMSHGGTGDVLCGLVGALLAKGMAPFDAARLGAWLSGKAGERAARRMSYGLLATDVLDAVPHVLATHFP